MSWKVGDWLRQVFGLAKPAEPPAADARGLREGFFEAMLHETRFVSRFPHYAAVLSRMDVVGSGGRHIAAVGLRRIDVPDSRLVLSWDVDFFARHPEYRSGVLRHEINHVICGHIDDASFHRVAYPRLMEVAMELTANEGIDDPLPPHGFQLSAFADCGIAEGQSTRERYVLLRAAYEAGRLDDARIWSPRSFDGHRPGDDGQGTGLADLLDARSDASDERNWAEGGRWRSRPSSRAELEEMKRALLQHLRGERGGLDDPGRERGQRRMAKELTRLVLQGASTSGVTQISWPRALREAFPRKRRARPDYLRPNRRFPTRVGEVPGRRRNPPRHRLIAAIDTSGSMTAETLSRIAAELGRLAPCARVTVVECDAAVRRVYPLAAAPLAFIGGGDTDFRPAFDRHGLHDVDGLVYFTDGKGTLPDLPPEVPTLWVLTHDDPFAADFGSILRLPR